MVCDFLKMFKNIKPEEKPIDYEMLDKQKKELAGIVKRLHPYAKHPEAWLVISYENGHPTYKLPKDI